MKVTLEEYKTMFKEIDGVIYTPEGIHASEEIDGEIKHFVEITKTVEENYQSIINAQKPQFTVEEKLSKEMANIKIDNMKKDEIIEHTLQTIANLKVEIMKLKGGNE